MPEINSDVLLICGIFLGVAAILFIVPTCMIYFRRKKLESYSYETDAEVINVEKRNFSVNRTDNISRLWVPTFRYTYGSEVYEKQLNVGTSKKIFETGDKVPIKVDTEHPEKFIQVSSYAHMLAVGILYTMSGLFVIFAASAYMIITHLGH
ncbi:MAG: DUF3592 domain-containing protein [Ruminococcus sp.]|nr:DUF3592 domain-containing protein [Ruminococcus sp.]